MSEVSLRRSGTRHSHPYMQIAGACPTWLRRPSETAGFLDVTQFNETGQHNLQVAINNLCSNFRCPFSSVGGSGHRRGTRHTEVVPKLVEPLLMAASEHRNCQARLVFHCPTTSASTANCTSRSMCFLTHCASYCALCQPLLLAFSR